MKTSQFYRTDIQIYTAESVEGSQGCSIHVKLFLLGAVADPDEKNIAFWKPDSKTLLTEENVLRRGEKKEDFILLFS